MQDLEIKSIFSRNLRNFRKSKKKTQLDLAFEGGVSLRHYQRIESGEKVPSVIVAYRLSKVLEISLDSLFV